MKNIVNILLNVGLLLAISMQVLAKPVLLPLTPEQGLSQGTVTNMMLDKDGFLWLATDGGLNRYDSTRIITVNNEEKALQDIDFSIVLQQESGTIWVATRRAGIYRFNREHGWLEKWFDMPVAGEFNQLQLITDMIVYSEDHLLLSNGEAVFLLHINTGDVTTLYHLPGDYSLERFIRSLYYYDGQVFIGTNDQLLVLDPITHSVQSIPYLPADASANQRHIKFFSVKDEQLWIGAVEGLYSIPLPSIAHYLATAEQVDAHARLAERNIWHVEWLENEAIVATELGLYQFYPNDNHYEFLWGFSDSNLDLTDNNIISLVHDQSGGFWLGTRYDGAYYWHPRSAAFAHWGLANDDKKFTDLRVLTLAETENRHLWVGTSNGLNRVDLEHGTVEKYLKNHDPKAFNHQTTIISLFPKNENMVYFSSPYGLFLFDAEHNTLLPLALKHDNEKALLGLGSRHFWQDRAGIFWFVNDEGFFQYTPDTGSIKAVKGLDPLPTRLFAGFLGYLPGSEPHLLLAFADQLWQYNVVSEQLTLRYEVSNSNTELFRSIDNVLLDQQQRLWVGFNGHGLLAFSLPDFEVLHHFHQYNQLESNLVFSLQQDDYGSIWFANHDGLFRMDPSNFHIEHFNKDDGLSTHEFNGRAGLKLHDGSLAYGSMRGMTLVQPERLLESKTLPKAVITELSLLDGSFNTPYGMLNDQQFSLPHHAEGLKLYFSGMNFRDKNKARFRVQLEGKQQFSYPEQTDTQLIIPKLPAGDYIFNVVSISPITGEESAPAQLRLKITSAWWASLWAYLIYSLVLATVALFWVKSRQQQQRLLATAHRKVKVSEQRLKLALAAVDSGAWEWLASQNSLFANRVYTMLGYREALNPLTLEQHVSLIHADDKAGFLHHWQRFIEQQISSFDHTYRLQHKEGHWLWFRDIGKIAEVDVNEQVIKVMGTFSNITEARASQEKARLFGEAFQKTRDWVVILDGKQRMIAANQSFADAFGPVEQYMNNPQTHHLGIGMDRRRYYSKLLREFTVNQHWQGEELIVTPDGRERPTLINISAVGDDDIVGFYVVVFTDITAQKLAEDELRYLANFDTLTGLPNRALLMDRIHHGIENAKRAKRSLALCFIDLDRFKQVNDSLGHDIGDLLLKEVGRRLSLTLRESDTVARLGGDEFVILLEGYKDHDNINHVSRKMLQIVGEPMQLGPHTVGVSPSIGIAVYPDDAFTAFELLKHADVAMYHAKENGRNNFQFFTQEMNDKAHMQLAKETRLRKAFQQQEFVNYYQPIIHSTDKSIVGVEVLLRWYSSDGVVSPAEFIPLAEDLSLIIPMTHALLERAIADLQHWHSFGHQLYLSVNLSARHLEHANLTKQTASLLEKYQLPADCLRFEVTESALMRDHESAIATMHELSKLGIKLALDDFGTGYSSLKYLKELPLDAIKIDRSFVKDIGIDLNDETIIETMLSMAKSMGMYCVAEGVETEQQLAFFTQRDCCLIQGYFFAQPMPSIQLLQLMQSKRFATLMVK